MAEFDQQEETSDNITPPKSPNTTPLNYNMRGDYSTFILPAILEMQKTLGQLTQAVTTLTEKSKENNDTLNKISHKIYAAEAILVIVGGVLIYFIHKALDVIVPLIQLKPNP
jgi:hypothetical protein